MKTRLWASRPRGREQMNIFYLYAEVVCAAVLAAAGAFNGAFVVRAGGANSLVGLLSSLPALVAIFLFLPSARVWEKRRQVMPWIVGSLAITRAGYGLLVLLPFVTARFLPQSAVAVLVAITVPSVFFSTGWSPMLAEVVPPHMRATVLAWRSILSSGTIAVMTLLAGRWLDSQPFPGNYQWMYAAGLIGGLFSAWLVSRIRHRADEESGNPLPALQQTSWRSMFATAQQENRPFLRIIANTLLLNLGAWMVMPLYIIFFVRQLGASDGWLGINSALANVGVVVGFWLWRRIVRKLGEHKALLLALPLVSIYPFLVGSVPYLPFILFAGFLINLINPGVDLSHSMLYLENLPKTKRHSWNAIYSMIMNIGAFVSPLIGILVSDRIGLVNTLFVGGAMRLVGASMFYIFPIGEGGFRLTWLKRRKHSPVEETED